MKIHDFSAKELVPLKNESWLDPGEKPISEAQFKERIKLTNISFETDSSVTFYFNDGGIFLEHEIGVTLSSDNTLTEANIVG